MTEQQTNTGIFVETKNLLTLAQQESEDEREHEEPEHPELGELICELSSEEDVSRPRGRNPWDDDFGIFFADYEEFMPEIETPEGVDSEAFWTLMEKVIRNPEKYPDVPANFATHQELWEEEEDEYDAAPEDEKEYYVHERLISVLDRMYAPDVNRLVEWVKQKLAA